ncbi:MAG: carbohydrate ABC transporter permease [Clostridia bacterium]|nr:carbohydrate ABC transporter permease [Clostridia bacterium]MBQ6645677.1 carbohydrate ABC transporter permease [Clostridia bacterium]
MTDNTANVLKMRKKRRMREMSFQTLITVITIIFVLLAFIPIFLMLFLSLKSQSQFYANLWALPIPPRWQNYNAAWNQLIRNMVNSVVTVSVGTLLIVSLAAMSGYVFARLEFPLKNFLFMLMLALMMIPGVLTLTPSFKLIQRIGLKNTWWALWLPWASGGQVMGMYLCRTFISNQPASLFESARIDGATEFKAFFYIALPLAKPILATLVVMNMISLYGDFIWPLLVIESNTKQVISVAIQTYSSATGMTDYGAMIAGFVMATVPLVIMFSFSSRLYIEGITSGAVKA